MSFEEWLEGKLKPWFKGYPYLSATSYKYSYEHMEESYNAGWSARKAVDAEIAIESWPLCADGHDIAKAIREKE